MSIITWMTVKAQPGRRCFLNGSGSSLSTSLVNEVLRLAAVAFAATVRRSRWTPAATAHHRRPIVFHEESALSSRVHRAESSTDIGRTSPNSTEIRSNLAQFWPIPAESVNAFGPNLAQFQPKLAHIPSNLAISGQSWPRLARFGRTLADLGRTIWGRICLNSAAMYWPWPNSGEFRRIWAALGDLGERQRNTGQHVRPTSGDAQQI